MPLANRDIAIITVLSAVAFLALLTFVTYRCSPSLFRRQGQHRAPVPGAARMPRTHEDTERINPVKLDRFLSNTTQASSLRSTKSFSSAAGGASGGAGGIATTTIQEVPAERV